MQPCNYVGKFLFPNQPWTSLQSLMDCINSVTIDYQNAVDHANQMAAMYEEYYVFADISRDSKRTPQSNPFKYKVFKTKVDIVGEIRALARKWPVEQSVPVGKIIYPINQIINRLYDAHTSKSGTSFNGVLGPNNLGAQVMFLTDARVFAGVELIRLVRDPSTKKLLGNMSMLDGSYLLVKSVNGKSVDKWLKNTFAENPVFTLPVKSLGARMNMLMAPFKWIHTFLIGTVLNGGTAINPTIGNFDSLSDTRYDVVLANGTRAQWRWVARSTYWGDKFNSTLLKVCRDVANRPAPLNKAITSALETFTKEASTIVFSRRATLEDTTAHEKGLAAVAAAATGPIAEHAAGAFRAMEASMRRFLGAMPIGDMPSSSSPNSNTSSSLTPTLIIGYNTNLKAPLGEWYVSPKEGYALLKLTSFDFEFSELVLPLEWLAGNATMAGVDKLIIDLVGNGGGTINTGMSLAQCLYPKADPAIIFGNLYDRRLGPGMKYALDNGLDFTTFNATFFQLIGNTTWIAQRKAELQDSPTLNKLAQLTLAVQDAIQVLYNISGSAFEQLPNGTVISTKAQAWQETIAPIRANLTAFLAGEMKLEEKMVVDMLTTLNTYSSMVNPYKGQAALMEAYKDYVALKRGGATGHYTKKITFAEMFGVPNLGDLKEHPFKQITAVTDGLCGSTCDTFSKTAYFYSKTHPKAPTFKFLSYGGTGERLDLNPTSFAGGDVETINYEEAWTYLGAVYALAQWLGEADLIEAASGFGDHLPVAAFGNSEFGGYTQSEVYQLAMGDKSPPMEFVNMPTDMYIKEWYYNTGLQGLGAGADLPHIYAQAVAKMNKAE